MKVVFVDIDGVLNTSDDYEKWGASNPKAFGPDDEAIELLFNPQLIARLNRITENTSAKIVVSSSWRLHYSGRIGAPAFEDLRGLLKRVGVKAQIIGATPLSEPLRWAAIEMWIERCMWPPLQPARYAILDDDVPHDDWRWKAHHVHCLALPGGLTETNEQQAIKLLTEGP
jgi:hypothetical protein